MLKKIKAFLSATKINERLVRENKDLQQKIVELLVDVNDLKLKPPNKKDIMKLVFDGKLEWYNREDLDPPQKLNYYNQAQHILRMDVFNNEINFLKSNWSRQAVIEAQAIDNPEEHLKKLSWFLFGLEMFKLRLSEIPNPEKKPQTKDNVYSNL